MAKKSNIHIKKSKQGSLHKALHVPKGEKIPAAKLKIKSTDSPAMKKKKQFAMNAKKFKHQTGGDAEIAPNFGTDPQIAPQDFFGNIQDPNVANWQDFSDHGNAAQPQQPMYNPGQMAPKQRPSFKQRAAGFEKKLQNPNPLEKNVNQFVAGVTDIANTINDQKLKKQEQEQMIKSMTPKFMTNMEATGLNNNPAYTKYGGHSMYDFSGMPDFIDADSEIGSAKANEPMRYGSQEMKNMEDGIQHKGPYGKISAYAAGGDVSSDKAKEILKDGTVHGKPLTDKQKRYFGWIAGGKKEMGGNITSYQTGGDPQTAANQANPDDVYGANATLQYYKEKLNDKLKAKDPTAFSTYFEGLQTARLTNPASADQYIESNPYDVYLSPDEVKATLGKEYPKYLQSLQSVNSYNTTQGKRPLYGSVEGKNDPSKLNYGRRFASLQTTPRFALSNSSTNKTYARQYNYDPTKGVQIKEEGDTTLRPQMFKPTISRDIAQKQTGGYSVGDEVDLSPSEIKRLKKLGYKIEEL